MVRGERHLDPQTLEGIIAELAMAIPPLGLCFAVRGRPARGLAGWRLTTSRPSRRPGRAGHAEAVRHRYAEVALLAAALKDETLMSSLGAIHLAPLADARGGGAIFARRCARTSLPSRTPHPRAAASGSREHCPKPAARHGEETRPHTSKAVLAELQIHWHWRIWGAPRHKRCTYGKGQHRRSSIDCIVGYAKTDR